MSEFKEFKIRVPAEAFSDIQEFFGFDSSAEVMEDALSILKWAFDELKMGRRIYSANKDGKDVEKLKSHGIDD